MTDRAATKQRIGDLLVRDGLIDRDMLTEALTVQQKDGGKVVEVLIRLGHITVDEFINFLSRLPGVASIDLSHYHISREIVQLIPRNMALKHEIFPIDRLGKLLTVGMTCPLDSATIESIELYTGLRIKPILCAQRDILVAIDKYYASAEDVDGEADASAVNAQDEVESGEESTAKARSGLKFNQVTKLLKDLTALPALPVTVERVHEAVDDLDIAPRAVAEIITHDPPISAKVLSVANSPAYGFQSRVDSVELAVALLGLNETYTVVLSAAVLNVFQVSKQFDYGHFWEESQNCAAAARVLGKASGLEKETGLFSAGLLHDIGRIALLETIPGVYSKVPSGLSCEELIAAEQDIIGIDHAEAGYELAVNWSIPETIALPIRFHHRPLEAPEQEKITAIISLAESWTRISDSRSKDKAEELEKSKPLLDVIQMNESMASVTFDLIGAFEHQQFAWNSGEPVATV